MQRKRISQSLPSLLVLLTLIGCISITDAKTVNGVMTTADSKLYSGQYIASFCFHGAAEVQFVLNGTQTPPGHLYLFLEEDWLQARDHEDCASKLKMARLSYALATTNGSVSVPVFMLPRIWHVVYADDFTCNVSLEESDAHRYHYMAYTLSFFNPDNYGNPTVHFSDEETGLLRFYQLLTLGYFLLACISAPRLQDTLAKRGPMHLVIQLLTAATALQATGAFLMMLHLRGYSKDGVGSPCFELLSELFDVLSQFAMLYMMLSLSLGWTLATTHKQASLLARIQRKPAARIVAVVALIQGVLFLWEQYEEREHRMYHAHRSWAGLILVLTRIAMAALFSLNLQFVVNKERSALKRDFYNSFTKSCLLWFLSYPVLEVLSWTFSSYFRYKFVTMSVVLCQCGAVLLLYQLFLSRALYWEVSALSSTLLPLRMDRHKLKLYS